MTHIPFDMRERLARAIVENLREENLLFAAEMEKATQIVDDWLYLLSRQLETREASQFLDMFESQLGEVDLNSILR